MFYLLTSFNNDENAFCFETEALVYGPKNLHVLKHNVADGYRDGDKRKNY